jgi:hypothetical protein
MSLENRGRLNKLIPKSVRIDGVDVEFVRNDGLAAPYRGYDNNIVVRMRRRTPKGVVLCEFGIGDTVGDYGFTLCLIYYARTFSRQNV